MAPPTGIAESDRANVQAAFDSVAPGGTVQFRAGRYVLGAGATLGTPDVTVLGHPDGTTLRGGAPESFDVDLEAQVDVVFGCTGLYVMAPRQTIRGLTFEYAWHGIVVGPLSRRMDEEAGDGPREPHVTGGHLVEGNTFRACPNGLRMLGSGTEPSIVRDNDFVDVFHAIGIYGPPVHFEDNRISVEEPERIPFLPYPGSAILLGSGPELGDCTGHRIERNEIVGYPDAIFVLDLGGGACHEVVIRGNTIRVERVTVPRGGPFDEPDAVTMIGAPITVMGPPDDQESGPAPARAERLVIEENRIHGGEGFGIELHRVSRSRIAGNHVSGIAARDPFPGRTWFGSRPATAAANGSGIWLSVGSDQNELAGNVFSGNATADVYVEGNGNSVSDVSEGAAIVDLGRENDVDLGSKD